MNQSAIRNLQSAIGIIPARFGSTRFPGKALADIHGKPMIQHVYERARQAKEIEKVIVATDDERIYQAVMSFGGEVVMTSSHHASGTDRVAEVAGSLPADIVVNIQGDEPLIKPEMIDEAVMPMKDNLRLEITTLKKEITRESELHNPNVVKVVTNEAGFALYFSRSLIPYPRKKEGAGFYKHIGLYVYRKHILLGLTRLSPGLLEEIEGLEQLRALENGIPIKVVKTGHDSWGVDTEEDLERVRNLLLEEKTEEVFFL
ncbi:MAG: 3-deoxy-manno-octulosonate cytidylyltransferase [bacterium]|nr:3-deoxy-manno-octulosonate cytidylyltransferase [bacterium]